MKNISHFRGLSAISAIALSFIALPSTASAQDIADTTCSVGCGDIDITTWTIQGASAFGGVGMGAFEGTDEGQVDITKNGGTGMNIIAHAEGCATIECPNGASSFEFDGYAFEQVGVMVTASGDESGVPVLVENGGQAVVGMALQVGLQRTIGTGHNGD